MKEILDFAGIDDAHYYWVDNIEKAASNIPPDAFRFIAQQAIFARDVLMLHLREHAKKSEMEIADLLGMKTEAVHQQLIKARRLRRKGLVRW